MKKPVFEGNLMRILLHLIAWTILLILPIYFMNRWQVGKDFIWMYYINTIINGIIFYGNYLVLIPRFFFGPRKYVYYLSAVLFISCIYFASDYSNRLVFRYRSQHPPRELVERSPSETGVNRMPPPEERRFTRPPYRQMHLYNYTLVSIFITFFALGLRVLERHANIEKRQKELEKEKLNSELAFLKNQISPHFFFNTLNNIYSLISISINDSQQAVLKLSRLMRYLLYESEQGKTSLSSEIEFMNYYIDLMKLRMSEKVTLEVSFPGEYTNFALPPLLFIPFIENAFKHGISYREKSFIRISMIVLKDSITFRCVNSMVQAYDDHIQDHSGIGLENVKKRLNLLYPGKHELKIERIKDTFDISLKLLLEPV
jgi:hypothetical protein